MVCCESASVSRWLHLSTYSSFSRREYLMVLWPKWSFSSTFSLEGWKQTSSMHISRYSLEAARVDLGLRASRTRSSLLLLSGMRGISMSRRMLSDGGVWIVMVSLLPCSTITAGWLPYTSCTVYSTW